MNGRLGRESVGAISRVVASEWGSAGGLNRRLRAHKRPYSEVSDDHHKEDCRGGRQAAKKRRLESHSGCDLTYEGEDSSEDTELESENAHDVVDGFDSWVV